MNAEPIPTALDLQRWTAEYNAAFRKGDLVRAGTFAVLIADYCMRKANAQTENTR